MTQVIKPNTTIGIIPEDVETNGIELPFDDGSLILDFTFDKTSNVILELSPLLCGKLLHIMQKHHQHVLNKFGGDKPQEE